MTISGDDDEFTQVEVDTFTIGDQPKFAEEDMGDGVYGYCFEFVTPAGDSALSKLVQFTIQDGKIVTAVE